jgi:hypothetical protein
MAQIREGRHAADDGEPGATIADLRADLESRRKTAA